MKTTGKCWIKTPLLIFLFMLLPSLSLADPGDQYCITPPFITAGIKPNLLLMIDNSASMYDLAYVDKGKKHCATNTGTSCFYDSDCPSGDTCSVFDRSPFYCYDETYEGTNNYYGYFDKDTFYYYRSGTDDFAPVASAFPSGCGSVSAGSTTKSIANTICVEYLRPNTLYSFVAKGNYLNWLTASKLDIEKKILTGGKFDGSGLILESRGCVGQGYVKDVNTADFVNYSGDGTNNTNTGLGVTFTVTGPSNPFNSTAPSAGGETHINLYAGNALYNSEKCQAAITAIASASGAGQVASAVADCLSSTTPPTGACSIQNIDPNTGAGIAQPCLDTSPPATPNCQPPAVPAHCAKNSALTACTPGTSIGCIVAGNVCSAGNVGASCSSSTDCDLKTCSGDTSRTCSVTTPDCQKSEVMGTCKNGNAACRTNADCSGKNNVCQNYVAGYDYGTCAVQTAGVCSVGGDQGPCLYATGGNLGVCQFSPHDTLVKTSVFFGSSMQTCWALRKNNTAPGVDDYNAIVKNCPIIYAGYKSCSNNPMLTCTNNSDCGAGNTCNTGPAAIGPGNSALLCGLNYEGQMFVNDPAGSPTWTLVSSLPSPLPAECSAGDTVQACVLKINTAFCNNMSVPFVTDPTDAPSDTTLTDNLPAILSGIGVDAQLGGVIKTMRARVATHAAPSGLVQQFGDNIRLGAMSFNPYGSASETGLVGVGTPKVCSNDNTIVCTQDIDCGSGNSCNATTSGSTNLDGGRILYPIGYGYCATMTGTSCAANSDCGGGNTCLNGYCGALGTTVCTTLANCAGANQACISNSVGDHTSSGTLVKILDDVRANAWTPLSEAFYNAIGYFARNDAGKSRTDLRLNPISTDPSLPVDFNEDYNPSEYRCQQNYTLLVTDGSSTADRNSSVNSLATLYASQSGITQTTCTGAANGVTSDYGGNNNLPIMSWIARNRQISDLGKVSPASTTPPGNARDSINSYVVFNGESNGASGDCNSVTLLSKTAINGGTTLKQANDYPGLVTALTSVFQDVAAKAASGTAASILSNSEGSGANILQAVFYPKKIFEDQTAANWIGEMQNLWYYVDPFINNSTIREDTNGDLKLNLVSDYVTRFAFDNSSDKTMVQLYQDTNGDGSGDTVFGGLIDPDYVNSIWRAGKLLWSRDLTVLPRTIYTPLISGGTGVTGTGLMKFSWSSPDNSAVLESYLQASDNSAAIKLMQYTHGFDFPGDSTMRSRTVKIGNIPASVVSTGSTDLYVTNPRDKGIGVWKLGDIISSTPRVQSTVRLNSYNLPPPGGYNDKTYESYINSSGYQNRGMVYVGANDGMLHAFKLGILSVKAVGNQKASLSGTDLGKEQWAFIPKNFLPYLKYMSDPDYKHLYAIDGRTLILDASIGDAGSGANYWEQTKSANSWRTVVIGGMGIGGASAKTAAANSVVTPILDPADAAKGLGYSSYFALDVTDQDNPILLWEFNDPALGYSTSGPAIVRAGDSQKNGRWFAVFGSGPTGPIDTSTHQFQGRSSQTLKFFVVDLRTGALLKTIDTNIDDAFAGSMLGGAIDADRRAGGAVSGNYQDDAVYAGYVKFVSGAGWTGGGVGRIMIAPVSSGAQPDATYIAGAFNWSKVIDDIGPVTTSIARLQDTRLLSKNLWLYFGTGRYFYRDGTGLDDYITPRVLFGIKEPCYNTSNKPGNFLDETCSTLMGGTLIDQTSSVSTLAGGDPGWRIDLDASTMTFGAERVVTDPVALTNGTVLFTTFKPTMDKCGYGGNSFLRIVSYDNGGVPSCNALQGKVLVQLSTGEFKEVSMAEAFGCPTTLPPGPPIYPPNPGDPSGTPPSSTPPTTPLPPIGIGGGKPPSDAPPVISSSSNRPLKKILHIQEH